MDVLDALKSNPSKRRLDVEGSSGTGKSIVVKSWISFQVAQIERYRILLFGSISVRKNSSGWGVRIVNAYT
jgi:hypothetical protein